MRLLTMNFFLLVITTLLLPTVCVYSDSTVVFNEIMYHPAEEMDATLEWVELYNQMAVDMDISGWSIEGFGYTFGPDIVMPGRSYLVVAVSPTALEAETGFSSPFGPTTGQLSNAGETLKLIRSDGRVMDEVEYNDRGDWPVAPDGSGVSLAKIDRDMGSSLTSSWTFSGQVGGTLGEENFPTGDNGGGPVIIAEFNRWNIDFQGDENHLFVYGQTDPVDRDPAASGTVKSKNDP